MITWTQGIGNWVGEVNGVGVFTVQRINAASYNVYDGNGFRCHKISLISAKQWCEDEISGYNASENITLTE